MQYLEKLCSFFLFARIVLHMCPNEKYEKYLSVLAEWIALGLVLFPLLSGTLYQENVSVWEKQWKESMGISFERTLEDMNQKTEKIAEEAAVEEIKKQEEQEKTPKTGEAEEAGE